MTTVQSPLPASQISAAEVRRGVLAAIACHTIWGFLPLLLHEVRGVDTVLVVAYRTLFSLVFVGVLMAMGGSLAEVRAVLADRRKLMRLGASAVLLAGNWLLYVYAVITGNVLEASFGYFITPLVSVALGMVLLGERQTRWQAISIAIAAVAIGLQWWGLGRVPYLALGLAVSFGIYGFVRKTVVVSSTTGLFVETLVLVPLALLYIAYYSVTQGLGPQGDPYTMGMLVLIGPGTALPLLLFSFAIRRLRLTTMGMFQYLAPSLSFVLAVVIFHEPLTPLRLLSFALIWVSLAVFSWDSLRRYQVRSA